MVTVPVCYCPYNFLPTRNVYVIKSVVGDEIPLETIFRGVGWFLACEVVIVALLVGFPQISLYLPGTMD
jgi:TRAP-type mannitol/chloroaromatic compound transport system permease large subunit